MVNSAQTPEHREITNGTALKAAIKLYEDKEEKEKYEYQHERQDQGQLPRSEGNN